MSLEQANAFIEKMKSDVTFNERIMAVENVEERLANINAEGFDCTVEDIKALQSVHNDTKTQKGSLPLTWQSGGPCHTKCAAKV